MSERLHDFDKIVFPKCGEKPEWRGLQQDKAYMI